MEQLNLAISYDHILPLVQLTWREVRFGFDEGLIAPREVLRMASDRLTTDTSECLLELASLGKDDSVRRLLYQLAEEEAVVDLEALQRVWAFLALSWVFLHRHQYADALDVAEKIYADLGYPEQIRFIRYLPPIEDGVFGDPVLYIQWQRYLVSEESFFAQHRSPAS